MASKSKLESSIKELARLSDNRYCFDCRRPGPQQNVNLSINTFVCTTCAGLHRQFSHKIKTINMSSFTEAELEALQNGGNAKASKLWLSKWSESLYKVDQEDPKNIEQFMKLVYQQKKWAKDENEEKEKEKEKEKKEKKKKFKAVNEAIKVAGPNGILNGKQSEKVSQNESSFNPVFPATQTNGNGVGFDFLTNMSSLTFEESKQTNENKANNQPSFASGFEDSPFNQSRRDSFADFSSFPSSSGVSAPSANSSSSVVSSLVAHFRSVQTQFQLDFPALQQAIQSALNSLKDSSSSSSSLPSSSSIAFSSSSVPSSSSNAPKAAQTQDFFADLSAPSNGDDEDDGNPFGSDSEEEENQPRAAQFSVPPTQHPTSAMTQPPSFFPPNAGFPPNSFPATTPQAAAFFPPIGIPVQMPVQVPMQVPVHHAAAAQFAAQNAFLQHHHQQAQLAHAQQIAREQIQQQQEQQKRAVTDSTLFSGLNPL
jgi:hypothetical protein